jgi:hypothetical protein
LSTFCKYGFDEIYDYPLDYFINNKLIWIKNIQRDPSERTKDPNDRELNAESKLEESKTSKLVAESSICLFDAKSA